MCWNITRCHRGSPADRVIFTIHGADNEHEEGTNPNQTPFWYSNENAKMLYMQNKHPVFLHLRRDIELHLDTHGRQLDIQVAQDTRNRNNSDIGTTDELVTSAVLPGVASRLRASSLRTTSSTSDIAGINTLSVAILVDGWLC